MSQLLHNIRFRVLVFSCLLSIGIPLWIFSNQSGSRAIVRVTDYYALTAITYLYITLLAGPLCKTFTLLPFRGIYLKARRALGVSAFYFSFLHACFAFFGLLGGFAGLSFLDSKYLIAISFSFTALIILSLMAATSFDVIIAKMGFEKWKFLHRFVYLAGILVLIHAVMLGTQFNPISRLIPQLLFTGVAFLLLLHAYLFDKYTLQARFSGLPAFGITFVLAGVIVLFVLFTLTTPNGTVPIFGIHSQHIQLAKEASQNTKTTSTIPGLDGDKTKRYSISLSIPDAIAPNQDTPIKFTIFAGESGNPVYFFKTPYEKPLHLIIVDSSLSYFSHIHPTQTGNSFEITTQFPHEGIYHLYADFQPFGGIEQQNAFTLKVGNSENTEKPSKSLDSSLTKTVDGYQITLSYPKPLKASEMTLGQQKLTFTINDSNGRPVVTLKPYLNAFGHLVMLSEDDYSYVHVHPASLKVPKPNQNGGPTVEFLPIGIYGPFKPGIYRVFAQFNPNGKLILADFTIKVE